MLSCVVNKKTLPSSRFKLALSLNFPPVILAASNRLLLVFSWPVTSKPPTTSAAAVYPVPLVLTVAVSYTHLRAHET